MGLLRSLRQCGITRNVVSGCSQRFSLRMGRSLQISWGGALMSEFLQEEKRQRVMILLVVAAIIQTINKLITNNQQTTNESPIAVSPYRRMNCLFQGRYDLLLKAIAVYKCEPVTLIQIYLSFLILYFDTLQDRMKKSSTSSHSSQKSKEHQPPKPHKKFVTFQYNHLNCFKSTSAQRPQRCIPPQPKPSPKIQLLKKQAPYDLEKLNKDFSQLRIPRRNRGKLPSNSQQAFNNSILLLQYQTNEDEAQQRQQSPKSQQQNQMVNEVVNSCVRVITQDTEHTSNPISARYTENIRTQPADMHYGINHSFSHSYSSLMVPNYYYYTKSPPTRNKKAVSVEESKMFVIDADNIEVDGRTTIMIRNIPNKYTQELLLRTVQKNHKKKFDFFYLPLDFNNNCNVGYAFINFVHTKFIRDFYLQFHGTEWRKFNSSKVCHICYARIQGTTQLQAHFQNSNVINQKDKRLRPLIGIKNVDNIQSLVNKQKSGDEYQYQQ